MIADKVQRAELPAVDEFMDTPHYAHGIATEVIESLETELIDTKRAFMLLAEHEAYTSHGANRVFTKFIEMARDERTGK